MATTVAQEVKQVASIIIDRDLWKRIKKAAADDEVSIKEFVERAVEQHLKSRGTSQR